MNLRLYLERRARLVDRALNRYLPGNPDHPQRLAESMRYSLFGGGKRIRPLLLLAATEAVGGDIQRALPFACAVELIHTYSLIHDDLPAMDDDAIRRGKPTNHVVFGEGMAVLAGDALLTLAFRVAAQSVADGVSPRHAILAIQELADAAGMHGMVGGQAADLGAEGTVPDLPTVEFIHIRKTGALILAAVRLGAIVGKARPSPLRRLTRYGECFGLAFQIADDILDAEGVMAVTGKVAGRDRARQKVTFPAVVGVPAARQRARDLLEHALDALAPFPRSANPLRQIATFVVARACDGPGR